MAWKTLHTGQVGPAATDVLVVAEDPIIRPAVAEYLGEHEMLEAS